VANVPTIDAASTLFFVIIAAFASTLGVPTRLASAMHMMLDSAHFSVQVLINDQVFLVNASVGLYSEL
jgi:diacylglycerol kinase family enzyme